jgi:hypothetical protein
MHNFQEMARPKKTETEAKEEGLKLPPQLRKTLSDSPEKIAFLSDSGEEWFFRKETAIKHFGEGNFVIIKSSDLE